MPSLRRALLAWYRRAARDLPWRRDGDPYRVWLSEIMLQQTRVETVIPYYDRFLQSCPTVVALAAADEQHVLRLWAGLGYYSRARNLHAAAKCVVNEHASTFPKTAAALQSLPGIGRYTAAAIASICHGEPVAVLDGNVKRVIARLLTITQPINNRDTTQQLWTHATALLDPRRAGDFNQAMMELGATICVPRQPRCADCPVRTHCGAHARGISAELPILKRKADSPTIRRVAVAIRNARGELLLIRRSERGLLHGMWTLPGGEATSPAALIESIERQTGLRVEIGEEFGSVRHVFTHRIWIVTVHAACVASGRVSGRPDACRWITDADDAALPLATIDRKLLAIATAARAEAPIKKVTPRRKRAKPNTLRR
ncbi:MAG: A/G-specific adenine glycosylase [Phycisphaerae bacterium]